MNKRTLTVLIVLNAAMLVALAVMSFTPTSAQAQIGDTRADYAVIAAGRTGRTQHSVIILDVAKGGVMAVEPTAQGKLNVTGFRQVTADFERLRTAR
ncbi:MAG: hypothetical protein ACYC26_08595 [Phycisphaerales bacterium]